MDDITLREHLCRVGTACGGQAASVPFRARRKGGRQRGRRCGLVGDIRQNQRAVAQAGVGTPITWGAWICRRAGGVATRGRRRCRVGRAASGIRMCRAGGTACGDFDGCLLTGSSRGNLIRSAAGHRLAQQGADRQHGDQNQIGQQSTHEIQYELRSVRSPARKITSAGTRVAFEREMSGRAAIGPDQTLPYPGDWQ